MANTNSTSQDSSKAFSRLQITDLEALPESDIQIFKPGILAQGCSHQMVAPYESGKTFLSLVCAKEFLEYGFKVLYLDHENRRSSTKERLNLLGVDKIDKNSFLYINPPHLDLNEDSKNQWTEFLECYQPDLIVFDSQNGFLSSAGRDENSSTGFQEWANVYLQIPRSLDMTTLVIDHTGWNDTHSRGTSRKPDEFDIVWKVKVKRKFSRSQVGQLELKLLKDRDSLLDNKCLTFEIGGTPFQCQANSTHAEESGLSDDCKKAYNLISQNSKAGIGTPRKSINELFKPSKSKADNAIKDLLKENFIYQPEGSKLYWIVDSSVDYSNNPESPESLDQESTSDSSVNVANGNGEGVLGSRSLRTGPMDPASPTKLERSILEEYNTENILENDEDTPRDEGSSSPTDDYSPKGSSVEKSVNRKGKMSCFYCGVRTNLTEDGERPICLEHVETIMGTQAKYCYVKGCNSLVEFELLGNMCDYKFCTHHYEKICTDRYVFQLYWLENNPIK